MNVKRRKNRFDFKQFSIIQEHSAMKVGTDGVLIGAWADVTGVSHALDIGTGTGLIALMLAQRNSSLKIDAVEIDQNSATEARLNVTKTPWHNRITIIHRMVQELSPPNPPYDLVISNPPYFEAGTYSPDENRLMARHNIGLKPEDLINAVAKLLHKSGRFCIILPVFEGSDFIELASKHGLFLSRKTAFFSKPEKPQKRWLLEFCTTQTVMNTETKLVHYDENGNWTTDYVSLTKQFYLNL